MTSSDPTEAAESSALARDDASHSAMVTDAAIEALFVGSEPPRRALTAEDAASITDEVSPAAAPVIAPLVPAEYTASAAPATSPSPLVVPRAPAPLVAPPAQVPVEETLAPEAIPVAVPVEETLAPEGEPELAPDPAPAPAWSDASRPATALTWVEPATLTGAAATPAPSAPGRSLLHGARLRPMISRPALLVPLGTLAALVGVYAGTALLWPLHEVAPTVEAAEFEVAAAAPAVVTWPSQGSASVGVAGVGSLASSPDAVSIASLTKVVSSLMVLDRMPLAVGEQGPSFSFSWRDSEEYWDYRRSDQSALDVPVDGSLTQYQMLQGTLMASANNYIDRLAEEIWGSDRNFAEAAAVWLAERGLTGIHVTTPSGFDEENVATPEALIKLGERAMQNPVFAEIVGTPSAEIPGAGTVVNTNGMLADPGVVGIKTGTLVGWSILVAKDITIGDTTVHLYAASLNQLDDEHRLAVARSLFAETEAALLAQDPVITAGTVVGNVTTEWGESVEIVTDADTEVIVWNGATAQASAVFDLGDATDAGSNVGELTTTGPLNKTTTALVLAEEVEGPSPWWRLTHPLELLGLADPPK